MRSLKLVVLGATGAVGREMLKLLEEYDAPVSSLIPLGSEKSAGSTVPFRGEALTVRPCGDGCFDGADYVLGAVSAALSRRYAPEIKKSGAVYIDNSSAFRLYEDVPLVVPEVNGGDLFSHHGIIANPNCSTVITCMAVAALDALSPIETMCVSTYQAVSGAGQNGITELREELRRVLAGEAVRPQVFPAQIAMNVIPMIGSVGENRYTDEEMKMQNELRRILHRPSLRVSCTCVRVPVLRAHSVSVAVRTREKLPLSVAEKAIAAFPGCRLTDGYPTPLDAGDRDEVLVGRLREDLTDENGLLLWCCGDQLRKGAASNAVQLLLCAERGR